MKWLAFVGIYAGIVLLLAALFEVSQNGLAALIRPSSEPLVLFLIIVAFLITATALPALALLIPFVGAGHLDSTNTS